MTDDVEYPFVSYLPSIYLFFLLKCLFISFVCAFFTELFITVIIEFQEFFLCAGYKAFIR